MASYRLIDEMPGAPRRRPPFAPIGIFILNFLCLPLAVPFWVINWARLGQPEKRLLAGGVAVAAFALQIYLLIGTDSKDLQGYGFLPPAAFAYWQLYTQRPLYYAHQRRGGEKAPAWQLWVAVAVGSVFQLYLLLNY